ncbi:MAG: nicotinic acid mononucleotide adenylyltransferase [Bacteroidetes bacterium 4572_128]|nr:MAG: nicotinic acid mononucleotide adenylyltransferase [Bacteroidetes bacterium 4572_128]
MKIGLYFGSFNPVHIGHMAIANYIVEYSDLKQIWFIPSPQNPFKKKENLLNYHHRYELLNLAIDDNFGIFKLSDIEFKMPQPSYTINTTRTLKEKYPNFEFSILMGSDNLQNFHKWKNYKEILKDHNLYVYPRPNFPIENLEFSEKIKIIKSPLMEISSTFIRKAIKNGKNVYYFLPHKVYKYIKKNAIYEK